MLNGNKELGNTARSHGIPIAINRTYDIWHDFLHDMWYNIWHDIQDDIGNDTWHGILYDIQHDFCWFFFRVFNDIKSNTTSERLSVLTSNRTNYVTSGHLNVIWYDIQQDICCFLFFLRVQQDKLCDIWHDFLHDMWYNIWHDITYEITPDMASDMTFNRTSFFCWVFNDIKSNTPSDRLSVLTSNRTNYVISDMTSYVICDITSDLTSKMTYEMTPDMASNMTFKRTFVFCFDFLGVQFHFWFLVILSHLF